MELLKQGASTYQCDNSLCHICSFIMRCIPYMFYTFVIAAVVFTKEHLTRQEMSPKWIRVKNVFDLRPTKVFWAGIIGFT